MWCSWGRDVEERLGWVVVDVMYEGDIPSVVDDNDDSQCMMGCLKESGSGDSDHGKMAQAQERSIYAGVQRQV
jgi:hypothetical protein